jgi:hypothetical protein
MCRAATPRGPAPDLELDLRVATSGKHKLCSPVATHVLPLDPPSQGPDFIDECMQFDSILVLTTLKLSTPIVNQTVCVMMVTPTCPGTRNENFDEFQNLQTCHEHMFPNPPTRCSPQVASAIKVTIMTSPFSPALFRMWHMHHVFQFASRSRTRIQTPQPNNPHPDSAIHKPQVAPGLNPPQPYF